MDISGNRHAQIGSNSDAARKQFRYGHMASQLSQAGEPIETVQKVVNGTFNCETDQVKEYDRN